MMKKEEKISPLLVVPDVLLNSEDKIYEKKYNISDENEFKFIHLPHL